MIEFDTPGLNREINQKHWDLFLFSGLQDGMMKLRLAGPVSEFSQLVLDTASVQNLRLDWRPTVVCSVRLCK